MKLHFLHYLSASLSLIGVTFAQTTTLDKSEKVANGLSIHYRDASDLCVSGDLSLLPPRIQMSLDGMNPNQRGRIEKFMKLLHKEAGVALKASPVDALMKASQRNLEVRLIDIREPNRTFNIAATIVGGTALDPGRYRVQLALLKSDVQTELVHADIDSTPTVRNLLLGNGFSRQDLIRRNIRGQLKKLNVYWAKRQKQCIAGEPR